MIEPLVEFRPHHFLCTLGFVGEGYSNSFVQNFSRIAETFKDGGSDGDGNHIRVVEKTDSICAPCPNRLDSLCKTESKIQMLDQAHAKILGIRSGQILTWGEAKARIRRQMSVEKFEAACAPCEWKSLGHCRSALEALHAELPS